MKQTVGNGAPVDGVANWNNTKQPVADANLLLYSRRQQSADVDHFPC